MTHENYWEKIQNVADMVAEQKEQNGERFYTSFYSILLKMTKKYIDTDKTYTQKDYEEFKIRMSEIFNKAGVPIDVMNEIGMTPDKLFLKSISEKMNFENRTEQTIALLEIAKNSMVLGKCTNDLQDFTMNIYTIYEELKNGDNQKLLEQYTNTLLEAYYTTLQEPTTAEIRKGKYTFLVENSHIKGILDDLIVTPKIYSNPNTARKMFEKYPELYRKTTYNKAFHKMVIEDLPEDKQEQFKDKEDISDYDIKEAIMGKRFPDIEDITLEKIEQTGDIAKFYIIYDAYHNLLEKGDTDKANEFWKTFYEQEKTLDNNVGTRNLYNETLQLIAKSPEEVTPSSISKITTQFRDEILEMSDKTNENRGR